MKENRIRIREAFNAAQEQGVDINKTQLAKKVFPKANTHTAVVSLGYYVRGDSKNIDRIKIVALCDALECDANYLFGIKPKLK